MTYIHSFIHLAMDWLGHDISQMVYWKFWRKECILSLPNSASFGPYLAPSRHDDRTFLHAGNS